MRDGSPATTVLTDVYYVPHEEYGRWGIFDADDSAIEIAIERGGADLLPLRQIPASTTRRSLIEDELASSIEYIYGGRFVPHFGHFLIETLARLWPYANGFDKHQKIVMHGDGTPEAWFQLPFARAVFQALNLTPDMIIASERPFRIPYLRIAEAAFKPGAEAFRAYTDFCRAVGAKVLQSADICAAPQSHPIYFSKTRLTSGVALWINEIEIERYLSEHGVEVVHPQLLSLAEHIQLLASSRHVLGLVGSAHHVSLMTGVPVTMSLLSPERVNANFALIDALNENDSAYLFPAGTHNVPPTTGRFIVERIVHDAPAVAKALLARL